MISVPTIIRPIPSPVGRIHKMLSAGLADIDLQCHLKQPGRYNSRHWTIPRQDIVLCTISNQYVNCRQSLTKVYAISTPILRRASTANWSSGEFCSNKAWATVTSSRRRTFTSSWLACSAVMELEDWAEFDIVRCLKSCKAAR